MKYKLLLIMICIIFTLSSCVLPDTVSNNLIKPPKLEKEQQEIYGAFISDIGENAKIDFLYPNNGNYTSSFIVEDIDNTEGNEAIVFYKNNDKTNETNTISVNILDKNTNNQWHSVWITHETEVKDIDKVYILKSGEEKLILIGYDKLDDKNKEKKISIIKYSNNTLKKVHSFNSNEFQICDINNNGIEDLVLISDREKRNISVYEYNNNILQNTMNKTVNYQPYNKINTKVGYIKSDKCAIYLDETLPNGDIHTDIIYCEDNTLKSLKDFNDDLQKSTLRGKGLYLYDIDGDKNYEIPVEINLVSGNYNDKNRLIKWLSYDNELNTMQDKSISYVDMKYGFRFDIPIEWVGPVTYKKDELNNEIIFYIYNHNDKNDDSQKILIIKTFVPDINNSDINTKNYKMINKSGKLKYGYILYKTNTIYDITDEDVNRLFNTI